jgi:hypothetical protein
VTLVVTVGGTWNTGSRQVTGGVDVSQYVAWESLAIVNSVTESASTLSFNLRMPTSASGVPVEGKLCQITQDGVVVHAGPIRRFTQSLVQNRSTVHGVAPWFTYQVEASDWTPWLDHRPVYGVYPNSPGSVTGNAGDIVRAIIDDPSPYSALICSKTIISGIPGNSQVPYDFGHTPVGGGSDTITTGPVIPVQNIIFQNFTDVIGEIAREVGYLWHVSSDRLIHFYNRITGLPSPLTTVGGAFATNTLDLDHDVTNYDTFVWTKDTSQLITRVLLLNASLKQPGVAPVSPYTTFSGQYFFNVGYVPSNNPDDWDIKVWSPGANPSTDPPARQYNSSLSNVKLEYVDGNITDPMPWPDVAFICQTNMGFRLGGPPLDAGSTVNANFKFFQQTMLDRWMWSSPTSGVTMDMTFPGGQAALVSALDDSSLLKTTIGADEGSDGIYTRVISDSTLLMDSRTIGEQKADQWLRRFGVPLHLARFNSFTQGWRAGQSFTIQSSDWGISAESLYIQQVTMKPFFDHNVGQWKLRSVIECSNNPWGA